ncbi:hypothetical protein [Campylobacter geochelonis]|uniref:hypothetical protein n=1 Tax=Campylobacter geochelonis TaxID=1780362 RepID=UPI000AC5FC03|nr:hypothetical protein [Campylobacter geochelonis]QKF71786.1 hypothetical protein CGEO_1502 [Campylobacter geochelonis]
MLFLDLKPYAKRLLRANTVDFTHLEAYGISFSSINLIFYNGIKVKFYKFKCIYKEKFIVRLSQKSFRQL